MARSYYELGERLICVDVPSHSKHRVREVLARENAADAKPLDTERWKELVKGPGLQRTEWYDLEGRF